AAPNSGWPRRATEFDPGLRISIEDKQKRKRGARCRATIGCCHEYITHRQITQCGVCQWRKAAQRTKSLRDTIILYAIIISNVTESDCSKRHSLAEATRSALCRPVSNTDWQSFRDDRRENITTP